MSLRRIFIVFLALLVASTLWLAFARAADRRTRKAFTATVRAAYRNAAVLELSYRESGRYPAAPALPVPNDGWAMPFQYSTTPDGKTYELRSLMKDQRKDKKPPRLPSAGGYIEDFDTDLVFVNGVLVQAYTGIVYGVLDLRQANTPYLECKAAGGSQCFDLYEPLSGTGA